jgi:predicted metal-dependent hydrolase
MEKISYKLVFSRRRSISIIVSPDKGVIVRAPYRTSVKSIEKYLKEKSGWIQKHLENHSDMIRINPEKQYINGEVHLFLGNNNYLRISESAKPFVSHHDGVIEAGLSNTNDTLKIKGMLDKWYKEAANETFKKRLEEILYKYRFYGFSPADFTVRSLKSRWGSCTTRGKITLNADLIKLDPVYAEYVILHELCHLKYHNHGKDYYRLLEELVPDYKSIRRELRKHITR